MGEKERTLCEHGKGPNLCIKCLEAARNADREEEISRHHDRREEIHQRYQWYLEDERCRFRHAMLDIYHRTLKEIAKIPSEGNEEVLSE